MYRIIYLWQGERYWGPDCSSILEANMNLTAFKLNGWNAWIEHV